MEVCRKGEGGRGCCGRSCIRARGTDASTVGASVQMPCWGVYKGEGGGVGCVKYLA